jgi:hypothetical protein
MGSICSRTVVFNFVSAKNCASVGLNMPQISGEAKK